MKKIVYSSILIAGMAASGSILAATDGSVGGVSTGTLNIQVTINDEVRISGLSDITAVFDGTNPISQTSAACVYRNGTGLYAVTATGDGAGGAFTIDDGVNPPVAYAVSWDDGSGATGMTAGNQLTGQSGADPASDVCAGTGNNATVGVDITAAALLANPAGVLNGVLTLEVAPE